MGERFMLSNAQRRYVGLNPLEAHWDVMDIKGTLYYFEGDTIRKEISTSDSGEGPFYYRESELDVKTAENRTATDPDFAYLQYGLIYRELTLSEYKTHEGEDWYRRDYRREGNGFTLDLQNLERCVREGSNAPFYPDADKGGLNSPRNKEDKDRVFAIFGLDGRLGYEGN